MCLETKRYASKIVTFSDSRVPLASGRGRYRCEQLVRRPEKSSWYFVVE